MSCEGSKHRTHFRPVHQGDDNGRAAALANAETREAVSQLRGAHIQAG